MPAKISGIEKIRKSLRQPSKPLPYSKKVTLQVEVTFYNQGALPPCDVTVTTENGVKVHYAGSSAVDSLAQMAVNIGSGLELKRWAEFSPACSRNDGHTGPCNGFPRLNCPGAL